MTRARRLGARALLLLILGAGALVASAHAQDSVWDALREPGAVVVLRHSFAPGSFDPPDARLDDCTTQRNLNAHGRAQATQIGEAFRRNDIAVGTVLSSPRCRCLDTARLAFGRVQAWDVLGGALGDDARRRAHVAEITRAMAAHESGPPLVLVTHGSVVTALTGLDVKMGEFVVLRRARDGGRSVAGRLYVE
ncbi:MAG TPA: histidine phosphatase family protein [Methylomirabilota bacterium]